MTKQEIYNLMNANPVFHLATIDGETPRVRGMLLYKADEAGIVFHSGTMKEVYEQICKSPKAELCFNDFKQGVQLRVSGELEIVEDNNLKDEISEHPSREFLKAWKESGELADFYKTFAVFRLKNSVAHTWTLETNFAPKNKIAL